MNEGGPVPLGYGRVLLGSQVIAQTYSVYYENADGSDANISAKERIARPQDVDGIVSSLSLRNIHGNTRLALPWDGDVDFKVRQLHLKMLKLGMLGAAGGGRIP